MARLAFIVNSGHMHAVFLDSLRFYCLEKALKRTVTFDICCILPLIFLTRANQKTDIMDQSPFQSFTKIYKLPALMWQGCCMINNFLFTYG